MGNRKIRVALERPWIFYIINLKEEQITYQVHRVGSGINFKANRHAMTKLSPCAYMLYMSMVMDAVDREWAFDEEKMIARTSLEMNDLERAMQELMEMGYFTPGEICIAGTSHKRNAFHLWEQPVEEGLKSQSGRVCSRSASC